MIDSSINSYCLKQYTIIEIELHSSVLLLSLLSHWIGECRSLRFPQLFDMDNVCDSLDKTTTFYKLFHPRLLTHLYAREREREKTLQCMQHVFI